MMMRIHLLEGIDSHLDFTESPQHYAFPGHFSASDDIKSQTASGVK
jgi:hypothetical protein